MISKSLPVPTFFMALFSMICIFGIVDAKDKSNSSILDLNADPTGPGAEVTKKIDLTKRGITLPAETKVLFVPITTETTRWWMIDEYQAGFVNRRLKYAEQEKLDLVVLEIDTPGGLIQACEIINRKIAASKVPVIAFVNGQAFSGGAIISMGCKAIVMTPLSQIGGAQAVGLFGDLDADQREKARAMLTTMIRALAQTNNYPESLAIGMVDRNPIIYETDSPKPKYRFITDSQLEDWKTNQASFGNTPPPAILKTWKEKDEILDLSAKDAFATDLAQGIVDNREGLLNAIGKPEATIIDGGLTFTERTARLLSNPFLKGLLVLLAIVAFIWELKTPGHGIGYILGAFLFGIFFWLQFFAANAGLVELILFALGAGLIAAELFFIPGFGIAGFSGFSCVLLAVIFAFLPDDIRLSTLWSTDSNPFDQMRMQKGIVSGTMVLFGSSLLIFLGLWLGVRIPGLSKAALQTQVISTDLERTGMGTAKDTPENMTGRSLDDLERKVTEKQEEEKQLELQREAERRRLSQEEAEIAKEKLWTVKYDDEQPSAEKLKQLKKIVGKEGITETDFRPAGKVRVDGKSYHAKSEGEFLDKGVSVKIIEADFSGLIVRSV